MIRRLATRARAAAALPFLLASMACSHALEVRNLDLYSSPIQLGGAQSRPIDVGILPYGGSQDALFYFNSIVQRISMDPSIGQIQTDYVARGRSAGAFKPDLILSIVPHVEYRSSGWNFLINWPGFLIFTPAWNGYVYHADIMTQLAIHDGDGNLLSQSEVPLSYSVRQAEMDRTIFTGLTWFEVSALALFGGIYNAFVFDRDIIGQIQFHTKDNYANFVANQFQPKVRAAFQASAPPPVAAPPPTFDEPSAVEPEPAQAP